ncbi:alpha/beta hydrolase family protein [Leifsonia poae]|uniref:alpha/beta hydrolase family protein n=1 Tax=Leifsonia poae TaxID=110933 RepID=UPI001CBCDA6D|nr:alpha/beta fold hydrolase [Leifsonia poae]
MARSTIAKSLITAAGVAGGLVLLTAAGAGFVMARVARTVITPVRKRPQNQSIRAVDDEAGTVTLKDTPDSAVPGRYGLWFDDDTGYARIGGVIEKRDGTVTRDVQRVAFGELRPTTRARLSGYYYLEPEELGLSANSVMIETELGEAPAWHFPAEGIDDGRWVIQVHGWGATRQEGLRAVPVFHREGFTCLLASYRNDGDAPPSADRRYGLGGTEWRDIDAAIRFAQENGARSIVLMGWSMGGAVVLQTITRSSASELIRGIILDSPVIDWIDTLEYQARLLRLPDPITQGALRLIESTWSGPITGLGAPIDLASMNFVARASDLALPMLILHSDDDGFVPSTASRALARARSDIVTLVPFATALHTKLWNYDEERWTNAIADWLGDTVG